MVSGFWLYVASCVVAFVVLNYLAGRSGDQYADDPINVLQAALLALVWPLLLVGYGVVQVGRAISRAGMKEVERKEKARWDAYVAENRKREGLDDPTP